MIDSRHPHPEEPVALLRAQHNPSDAGIPTDLGRKSNSKERLANPQKAVGDMPSPLITGHLHAEALVEGRAGEVSGFA